MAPITHLTHRRRASNTFLRNPLDPSSDEEQRLVDHNGGEEDIPPHIFENDLAHIDNFLFQNKDQVLLRLVELGIKLPSDFDPAFLTSMIWGEERSKPPPFRTTEDILNHEYASTSTQPEGHNEEATTSKTRVGNRIPFIQINREAKTE
ncbi:hypothetical protein KI387_041876, partial [Taxus chinensis]